MNKFIIEKLIDAPIEIVWDAADFKKSVGPYSMKIQDPGDSELHFVGFTRAVTSGSRTIVERLLSVDPMRSYTYTLAEGVPVKNDYLGRVEFNRIGEATKLTWTVSFTPKYLGTGWFGALMIKSTVGKIIDYIEADCLDKKPVIIS